MSLSQYAENMVWDSLLGGTTFTKPTNAYFSLHTGLPGETGINECSGGAYARALKTNNATTFSNVASKQKTNAIAIDTFPELTGAQTGVMAVGVWDALTTGNFLAWALLWSGVVVGAATASTDFINAPGHTFVNNNLLRVLAIENGGAIPTGLTSGSTYYVVQAAGNTFKLSLTNGGAAIDITADGTLQLGLDKSKDISIGTTPQIAAGALVFYTV